MPGVESRRRVDPDSQTGGGGSPDPSQGDSVLYRPSRQCGIHFQRCVNVGPAPMALAQHSHSAVLLFHKFVVIFPKYTSVIGLVLSVGQVSDYAVRRSVRLRG